MAKKKLGILTFHTANNFGAVWQAYALKKLCEDLGYDVYFIRYSGFDIPIHNKPIKKFINSTNKKASLFTLIRSMISYKWDYKKESLFSEFRKQYMKSTVLCKSLEDIEKLKFDVYIAGSDQIWNYKITNNQLDLAFFLDIKGNSTKLIYAASSHDVPFSYEMEKKFKSILNETNAVITIREKSLANYASSLTKKYYPVVLDPTLVIGRNAFEKFETDFKERKPYILLYQIDANPDSDIAVKALEKRFKKKVYTLTVPRIGDMHGRRGDIGPEKFLEYIKNAEFIVTNSFHGIALSILFEKDFFVYENSGVMSRIDDLLNKLEIKNRKVTMVRDINPQNNIDYSNIKKILQKEQQVSYKILVDALNGNYKNKKQENSNIEKKKTKEMKERSKQDCSGCCACEDICPVHAIKMKRDKEGFLYPKIDKDICLECGKCDRVCLFNDREQLCAVQHAYGVKHKELKIRERSRSGAAFVAFSDWILQKDGVVYGAVMNKKFEVHHERATTYEQRNQMQKAKYVQSDTKHICLKVEKDLNDNKYVLFSGTPCQIAGLQGYLKEKNVDTNRLYTCDLICHGVPSPNVWKDYIGFIENKFKKKVIQAEFRDKEFGWEAHYESFKLMGENKKRVTQEYTNLFYKHIILRPSCSCCKFANMNRVADITLGDFWGIEKHNDSFNDNRGISLIFTNTRKGNKLFQDVKEKFEFFECNPQECMQPTLQRPSKASVRRKEFWYDYERKSFDKLLKKYAVPVLKKEMLKYRIKKVLYILKIRQHP